MPLKNHVVSKLLRGAKNKIIWRELVEKPRAKSSQRQHFCCDKLEDKRVSRCLELETNSVIANER